MADVAVIVPWRPGCPHREQAWEFLRARWAIERPSWHLVEGEHVDGPWCKAAAVTAAIAHTDADVLVIADADVWCDDIPIDLLADDRWVVPHREVRRLDEASTAAVLHGAAWDGDLVRDPYDGHAGGGMAVVTRDQWNTAPMDPRFRGWGQEDDSWALALKRLVGQPIRGTGTLWHLWHPLQPKVDRTFGSHDGKALWARYVRAREPQQMRALIDEGRLTAGDRQ